MSEIEKKFDDWLVEGKSERIRTVRDTKDRIQIRLCFEYGINEDKKVEDDKNPEKILNDFLSWFMEKIDVNESLDYLKKLEKVSAFEKEYLNNNIKEEDKKNANVIWKKDSEEYINKVQAYRIDGIKDQTLKGQLAKFAKGINNDPLRYIYEIIQNADDCEYNGIDSKIKIEFLENNKIKVTYNEEGMTYRDILAITTIGESNKQDRTKKRLIGEKGIGFKTIFSACKQVDIHSGGYHFSLSDDNPFVPIHIVSDDCTSNSGTTLILYLLSEDKASTEDEKDRTVKMKDAYDELKKKYGFDGNEINYQKAFQNCPILFTNTLTKITLKDKGEEISIIKCKGSKDDEITLKFEVNGQQVGNNIECYHQSYDVVFKFGEYNSRYKNQFTEDEYEKRKEADKEEKKADKKVITYPIEIIAPKINPENKTITEGSIYSYLPTSVKINAPISIHIPAKLSIDRSRIHFDGDQDTINTEQQSNKQVNKDAPEMIKWNERLFDELFFKDKPFIQEFYEFLREKVDSNETMIKYIPVFNEGNLFDTLVQDDKNPHSYLNTYCKNKNILEKFKNIEYLKVSSSYYENSEKKYCKLSEAVMLDQWMEELEKNKNFRNAYFDELCNELGLHEETCLIDGLELSKDKLKNFKDLGFTCKHIKDEDDEKKIKIINKILDQEKEKKEESQYKDYIECVQNHIQNVVGENQKFKKGNLMSNYFPESIEELTIFPVKREKETEFVALNSSKNYWFKEGEEGQTNNLYFSTGQICIWDNDNIYKDLLNALGNIEKFEIGNNSDNNGNIRKLSAENIWEDIIEKEQTKNIDKNLLEEIMILLDKLGVLDEQENTDKEQVEIQSNGNNNNDNNQQTWQNKLKEILLTKNKGKFWIKDKKTRISTIIKELF